MQVTTIGLDIAKNVFQSTADDPTAGWKGRGLWADYASYVGWHIEGGPGTLPKAVKFQLRPNPLAK